MALINVVESRAAADFLAHEVTSTGGSEIETVLLQERLARHLQGDQKRGAQ
jgi:hypothetical protein